MEKVYIAGKIAGDCNFKEKFRYAEKVLMEQGFIVLNPASFPDDMHTVDYVRMCFSMIDCADIVAFLPDYIESKGAMLEFGLCQYICKQTMFLRDMGFYRPLEK